VNSYLQNNSVRAALFLLELFLAQLRYASRHGKGTSFTRAENKREAMVGTAQSRALPDRGA